MRSSQLMIKVYQEKKKQVDCSDSSTQAITSVLGEELNDFGK